MKKTQDLGLNPLNVLRALADEVRWEAVRLMASGATLHATQLAAHFGRDVDGIGKHLRVLAQSGAASSRAGSDARHTLYFIPERFRPSEGVVDYGFCELRFPDAPVGPKD